MKTTSGTSKAAFYLRKGIYELAHHRPAKALALLRQSVEITPPSCENDLSKALYWLSIALLRLDQRELAVRSLANAQKIRRQSYARKVYVRNINEYGMLKRPTRELDDLYAFVSIQLSSYLLKKPQHRFGSQAEHSAVLKLILETWKQLKDSDEFKSLECGEKLLLFRKLKIDFPIFGSYSTSVRYSERFAMNIASVGMRTCSCGSGLPFEQCCGRVQGLSEI